MRKLLSLTIALVALVLLGADGNGGEPAPATAAKKTLAPRVQTVGWSIWQSDNFRVCTRDPKLNLGGLVEHCEKLKERLDDFWFAGEEERGCWTPKCDVVVHSSLEQYQQALGAEVGTSAGCATLQYDGGQVESRRLDIRIDADNWQVDALPHELTHIVIADRLGNRPLPPWLDEGIGVLSESNQKRKVRVAAFEDSRRRGTVYLHADLVRQRQFPQPYLHTAFYAQSAGLVRHLMNRGSAEEFVHFADQVLEVGAERALKNSYGIKSLAELDRVCKCTEAVPQVARGGTLPESVLVAEAR